MSATLSLASVQTRFGHTWYSCVGTQLWMILQLSLGSQIAARGSAVFQRAQPLQTLWPLLLTFGILGECITHNSQRKNWQHLKPCPPLLVWRNVLCRALKMMPYSAHTFSIRPCFANGATSEIHGMCSMQTFASLAFSWEEYAFLLIKASLPSYSHCWLPAIMPIVVWVENMQFSNLIYSI